MSKCTKFFLRVQIKTECIFKFIYISCSTLIGYRAFAKSNADHISKIHCATGQENAGDMTSPLYCQLLYLNPGSTYKLRHQSINILCT